MDIERRALTECRAEGDGRRITGYAIRFGVKSLDLGGFQEIIAPEAVDRSLKGAADIRAFVDHDHAKIIGRTRSGTLALRKDTKGLRVEIDPDLEISYAKDIARAVARGDVSGMSFGFRTIADAWDYDGDVPIRTVTDMDIHEVSVVTMPAYPQTSVEMALRSLADFQAITGRGSLRIAEARQRTLRARWF